MARSPRQEKGEKVEYLSFGEGLPYRPSSPEYDLECVRCLGLSPIVHKLRHQPPRGARESTLAFWDFCWHSIICKGCFAGTILLSLAYCLATQCVFTGHYWGLRAQASGQLIPKNVVSGMLKWSCQFPCWPPGCDIALVEVRLCWFLLSLVSGKCPALFSGHPWTLHGIKKVFKESPSMSQGRGYQDSQEPWDIQNSLFSLIITFRRYGVDKVLLIHCTESFRQP